MRNIVRALAATAGMLAIVSLAACGSAASTPTPTTSIGPTIQIATPTPTTAPATPGATATPVVTPPTPTPDGVDDHLIAMGMDVYDKTAGGVGCAYCHLPDASGNLELGSPDIRGATEDQIWDALETRALMTFITLTDEEVTAVAAYLSTLAEQQ